MIYDFDTYVDRRGSKSYKWDSPDAEGAEYPLWVADMDWRAAEPILAALRRRVEHGVFGYVTTPNTTRKAVCRWFHDRHHWDFRPEQVSVAPGVVPALAAILRQHPGRVLLHTPAYNCFFSVIDHASCTLVSSPLLLRNDRYEMDWEDLEHKMAEVDICILCNPHNPSGRVWTRDELTRFAHLAHRHQVLVISDEIHCEFAWHDDYTPFATVAPRGLRWIVMTSATKAFNIAGLQFASIISSDAETKGLVDTALEYHHLEDVNPFGQEATIAAYEQGADWLEQMNHYVEANYRYLCESIDRRMPGFRVIRMDGTYLAWVQLPQGTDDIDYCRSLLRRTGVKLNPGSMYGGPGFVRINLACPRVTLAQALERLPE